MKPLLLLLLIAAALCAFVFSAPTDEIKQYKPVVDKIIREIVAGKFRGNAYNKLADMTDLFGHRMLASKALDSAIVWLRDLMLQDGFENVRLEPVPNVVNWIRGNESLTLLSPRITPLPVIGLGLSVGTPEEGITANVVVVDDWAGLEAKKHVVNNSIVFFNCRWAGGYGKTVEYRVMAAVRAAKYGAKAVLIRSIAPFSIGSPHTGLMHYEDGVPKIPAAAISLEDADMLDRMDKRGSKIVVRLKMDAKFGPPALTYNVVGEIKGSSKPEEVIVIGGHIDSWDAGPQTGAMDDGCGVFICYEAVRALLGLGIRPKRTIRVVAWVGEETGGFGAIQHAKIHEKEIDNILLAFESDGGAFKPQGFGFTGSDAAFKIVQTIATELLQSINTTIVKPGGGGADIGPLMQKGVPGMMPLVENSKYFWYHHSVGDSMSVLDRDDMDLCTASIAGMMFVVADMDTRFPRK